LTAKAEMKWPNQHTHANNLHHPVSNSFTKKPKCQQLVNMVGLHNQIREVQTLNWKCNIKYEICPISSH